MDTVNWRFNSNSDQAIEFRGFPNRLAPLIFEMFERKWLDII